MITNRFTHIAFLIFFAGMLLFLEKETRAKIFNIVPPLVWIYVLNMVFYTMGLYNSEACANTYSALKNSILYAMISIMLLRCDFKKLSELGERMVAIFLGCSLISAIGFLIGYPIFKRTFGTDIWGAAAALYASWVDGSANMAAIWVALPVDTGAYSYALALGTVCYSVWIALLLFAVKYAGRWNTSVKVDTSALQAIAESANTEVAKEKEAATSADWIFLIGLSLTVSALSQMVGKSCDAALAGVGLGVLDKGILTTVFVSILRLIYAGTSFGKLPTVGELSDVYLYVVASLPAPTASVSDLLSAPMWVIYGLFILMIHMVFMYLLSKVFHWDLCMVSAASLASIGGSTSAPTVASAYDAPYAGIGVLIGVLGAAIGNFCGLDMGTLLRLSL